MKMAKTYEPGKFEDKIYKLWEQSRAFEPKNRGKKGSYSIVMPPPNANANLHIGYALVGALEDIATRYHRMKGEATLLLPGADHAGFETQVVYEKHLAKEGKSRFDFSREELYKQVWDFVAENRENFEKQFRILGISCDWSRYTFTLDEKIVDRAYKTFQKMWDDGLIYRGERLVNYCTHHGTAFADIEVEYHTEQGKMYYIHFPLNPVDGVNDKKNYVLIATTRPETMLGDVAVAVHPEDKRFANLVGRTITVPLAAREVPIIADKMVDREFGTGAVKITAAHDPNDFDVAKNHNLPLLSVITEEGKIGHDAPHRYHGLEVLEARKKVVKELDEKGLLEKIEDHEHRVGHCYKCKTVIQPLVREQWFVDMKPLAKEAINALKADKIKFYPNSKKDQLVRYLEGLRDWNISRQIAWGIPIPAFQNIDDPEDWIFDTSVDKEIIEKDGKKYRRDPDVFDTWFSSSSWPYATLDYPDGKDFKKFYPLSLMETGGEILYPWVSRMIMLGLYVTGDVPFEAVYIHGYVMAEDGSKMSKSVGNVIDPLPVIEKYGSDALRMGLIAGRAPAINRGYDPAKIEGGRNFCNKLWNMARFIEGIVGTENPPKLSTPKPKTIADHWVLSKLQHLSREMTEDLDGYGFAEAYEKLYHFVWDDFADWYIEASKSETNREVLTAVLADVLKLAHPFAPFVTEAIWQELGWFDDSILATEQWPEPKSGESKKAKDFDQIQEIVTEIRGVTTGLKLSKPNLLFKPNDFIETNKELVQKLAKLGEITDVTTGAGLQLTGSKHQLWLDIDDAKIKAFASELDDKVKDIKARIKNLEARLKNKAYVEKAPEKLVIQSRAQLEELQAEEKRAQQELARFK